MIKKRIIAAIVDSVLGEDIGTLIKGIFITILAFILFTIITISTILSCPIEALQLTVTEMLETDKQLIYEYRPDLNASFIMPVKSNIHLHEADSNNENFGVWFESDGTNVYAVADGVVYVASENELTLEYKSLNPDNSYSTYYIHYYNIEQIYLDVNETNEVLQGQVIGKAYFDKANSFDKMLRLTMTDSLFDSYDIYKNLPVNTFLDSEVEKIEK